MDGLYIDHFSRDITASITGNTLYNNGHTFNYGGSVVEKFANGDPQPS